MLFAQEFVATSRTLGIFFQTRLNHQEQSVPIHFKLSFVRTAFVRTYRTAVGVQFSLNLCDLFSLVTSRGLLISCEECWPLAANTIAVLRQKSCVPFQHSVLFDNGNNRARVQATPRHHTSDPPITNPLPTRGARSAAAPPPFCGSPLAPGAPQVIDDLDKLLALGSRRAEHVVGRHEHEGEADLGGNVEDGVGANLERDGERGEALGKEPHHGVASPRQEDEVAHLEKRATRKNKDQQSHSLDRPTDNDFAFEKRMLSLCICKLGIWYTPCHRAGRSLHPWPRQQP